MGKKNTGPLPRAPPFQEFKQQLKAKYTSLVSADGVISEADWAKAVTQAAEVVTKNYGPSIKKKYLFERVKSIFKESDSAVDFRREKPPSTKDELKSRLSTFEGYLQSKGLGEEYMKNYEELNKLHLAPASAESEIGESQSEEKKDEPVEESKIVKLRTKIKKARGEARGRIASEDSRMRRLREQAYTISQKLLRAGTPPGAEIMKELLSVRTGLDFSNVSTEKSILGYIGEQLAVIHQEAGLSPKYKADYKYLGAYRGSFESLLKGETPINELDILAAIHDMAYLEASAEQGSKREQMIRQADDEFVSATRGLSETTQDNDMRADAKVASLAISSKGSFEKVFGQFDLSTTGVKKMSREQLMEKTSKLIPEIKGLVSRLSDETVRAQLEGNLQQITALEEGAPSAAEPLKVMGSLPTVSVNISPYPTQPQPPLPGHSSSVRHSSSVQQSEVETTGAPGGIEKKAIGLEDVLKSLEKMNASTNPLSITPVTGERNLRPLLVKGDVPDIVKRTPKEIEDNRNYYAAWKWVQEGAGNGNQQPLPDQVGMPANNRIWDMQKRNERFKYMDNYDGGAKDWYQHKKATLGKYVRTAPVVRKKYVIPMYSDNQRHQWPTRNGGLPAGCGHVIKMARDKADGFEIFSPLQVLMAKQTRLFHGDVVESEGRLTRV